MIPADVQRSTGRRDLAWAIGAGIAGCALALLVYPLGMHAADLRVMLRGSAALLRGADPYQVPLYFYPVPAGILLIPLARLAQPIAAMLFTGISLAVLAWAILRSGRHRLPLLACLPLLGCPHPGQWGALLAAAYLLPGAAWLLWVKPQFLLPLAASRSIKRHLIPGIAGGLILLIIGQLLDPYWLMAWLRSLRSWQTWYRPLILAPLGGPLLGLALIRWRDRDARLLFALACVPQTPWLYNATPLLLVPQTLRQSWRLAALGWLSWISGMLCWIYVPEGWKHDAVAGCSIVLFWLPVLWVVLSKSHSTTAAAITDEAQPAPSAEPV